MGVIDGWKQRAHQIKRDSYALYFACRDPRTPWYAKAIAAALVAYAFSPIDLIPDFIPVLGYVDDLIIIPAGILLVIRMVPAPVMAECRVLAAAQAARPTNRAAAVVIVFVWLFLAGLAGYLILDALGIV